MRKLLTLAAIALCLVPQLYSDAKPKNEHAKHSKGPKEILIVRHAEKPGENDEKTTDPNLSPKGFERAKALARVIPANFGKPDFLFATKRSKHSNRPIETITSLSEALHLPIDDQFKDEEFAQLAHLLHEDHKICRSAAKGAGGGFARIGGCPM